MKKVASGLWAIALVVASSLTSFAGYAGTGGSVGGYYGSINTGLGPLGNSFLLEDATGGGDAAFHTNGGGHTGDFNSGFGNKKFFVGSYSIGTAPASGTITFSSSAFGTYVGTIVSDNGVAGDNSILSRQIVFNGTYTPGTDGAFSGNTTPLANTSFQITVSKSSAGGAWSGNWTLDTTASAAVPEPTSMAIFGLGAVGFAVRRFRRK